MSPYRRIIFGNTLAGLYQEVRAGLSPAAHDRLREVGVDFRRPLLPAYPAGTFARVVQVMAEELDPGVPRDEALRRMGRRVLDGYRSTFIGRSVARIARLVGVRRTLQQMTKNFRSSDNFTVAEVEERGPHAARVWLNDAMGMPTYYAGFFEVVVEASGGRVVRVQVEESQPPAVVLSVEWDGG